MIGEMRHEVSICQRDTHAPLVRRRRHPTIANPGSISPPFAEYGFAGNVQVLDHAAYGVIEASCGTPLIEFRQVAIDAGALTDEVHREPQRYAYGEWWLEMRSDQRSGRT